MVNACKVATTGNTKGGDWWTASDCQITAKCPGSFGAQNQDSMLQEWFEEYLKPMAQDLQPLVAIFIYIY